MSSVRFSSVEVRCDSRRVARWTALLDRLLARWIFAAAPRSALQPRLDLHGLGVQDAIAATERFLRDAQESQADEVLIVYGKGRHSPEGRGVLRQVIPRWLDAEGRRYVISARPEPDLFGEDGAMRVRIRARSAID